MRQRSTRLFTLGTLAGFLAVLSLTLPAAALGETLATGPNNRGVITIGSYQVFPENRPGNGVYNESVLVLSLPGQTIHDIINLPPRNKFIYLARQGESRTVAVKNGPNDPPPRVTEVTPGYYFVVTVLDTVAYKKLLLVAGGTLVDMLPLSKTADGVTPGQKGIVFFHIGKADQRPDGRSVYSIGVHFVSFEDGKVRHLGEAVENGLPSVSFKWINESAFQVKLSDGSTQTLNIADLK
jgi:hypothetical protein